MSTYPLKQAGGGIAAGQARDEHILNFSPAILKHINQIHRELAVKDQSYSSQADLGPFLNDSFDQLLQYLASPQASILGPVPHNDLSFPLSSYYISSSHNTYLTGNQLSSHSSTDLYKNVLLQGCRSVEIDVWDGKVSDEDEGQSRSLRQKLGLGSNKSQQEEGHSWRHRFGLTQNKANDEPAIESIAQTEVEPKKSEELQLPTPWTSQKRAEPRVLHGHTLTSEVSFRQVCKAIRETAFTTSDLPIIISLEIHTSHEQQQMMVDIMRQVWHGLLVLPPRSSELDLDELQLPNPGDLRNKILVKVKYTPPEDAKKKKLQRAEALKKPRARSASSQTSDDEAESKASKTKKQNIISSLSELGVYTRSFHFKDFHQSEAEIPTHVFSLTENTVLDAQDSHPTELFRHNQNYLMRVYPKALRVSSSNLNPLLFWRLGAQMVALNWQDCDKGVMLNEGMFSGTGGWVLKPPAYRSNANISTAADSSKTVDITIECFAAQNLPLPDNTAESSFRPYISCTFHVEKPESKKQRGRLPQTASHDSDADTAEAKMKAHTRTSQGTSPDFGGETIRFQDVDVDQEALCFVRFKIEDDVEMRMDRLAAWACVRLDRMQEGIRTVRLFDSHGKVTDGILLLRVLRIVKGGEQNLPEVQGGATALPLR